MKDSVGVKEGMKDVLEDRVTVKEKDASLLFVGRVTILEGEEEADRDLGFRTWPERDEKLRAATVDVEHLPVVGTPVTDS